MIANQREQIRLEDMRLVVYMSKSRKLEYVKSVIGMTNDDVIQECLEQILFMSERKSTKAYRDKWVLSDWDATDHDIRKSHRRWLRLEFNCCLSNLRNRHNDRLNNLDEEEYQMWIKMNIADTEQKQRDIEAGEEIRKTLTNAAMTDLDFAMIAWKMDLKSADSICQTYKISRRTLTTRWSEFLMRSGLRSGNIAPQ